MAKILIGLYNALYTNKPPFKFPCWYDGFIRGLSESNDLYIWQISEFGRKATFFTDEDKEKIRCFEPDLAISFNNVLPDLSDVSYCPEIILIVDSILYVSNLEYLLTNDRLFIGSFQEADLLALRDAGVDRNRLFVTRPYTAIKPDDSVKPDTNIAFIGSRFGIPADAEVKYFSDLGSEAVKKYGECLTYVASHPLIDKDKLIRDCKVMDQRIIDRINVSSMVMLLSAEKRVRVLSTIVDLGLSLYGTRTWLNKYHYDSRLNLAFIDQEVWTVEENQNIYNHAKVGINVSHVQAVDGFPWRIIDILSSNACLVSDYHSGFDTFLEGCYFPTYRDPFEARDLCRWLLRDDTARRQIVRECNLYVKDHFTLDKMLAQLEDITSVRLRKQDTKQY
jgi:hypothetical protein